MENKDDLISRRAALDAIREDIGTNGTYDIVEALPGQMTAEEAWGIAKEIVCDSEDGGLCFDALQEAFGEGYFAEVMRDFTPEEAKAKIEAWENRLRVGDVVEHMVVHKKAIITSVSSDGRIYSILFRDGNIGTCYSSELRKTGETIDIQGILERLGE